MVPRKYVAREKSNERQQPPHLDVAVGLGRVFFQQLPRCRPGDAVARHRLVRLSELSTATRHMRPRKTNDKSSIHHERAQANTGVSQAGRSAMYQVCTWKN